MLPADWLGWGYWRARRAGRALSPKCWRAPWGGRWLWWKSPVSVGAGGGVGGGKPAGQTDRASAGLQGSPRLTPGRQAPRRQGPDARQGSLPQQAERPRPRVSPFMGQWPTGSQLPRDPRQLQPSRPAVPELSEREPHDTVTSQARAGAPVPCAAGTQPPRLRWSGLGSPLPPPAPRQGSPLPSGELRGVKGRGKRLRTAPGDFQARVPSSPRAAMSPVTRGNIVREDPSPDGGRTERAG